MWAHCGPYKLPRCQDEAPTREDVRGRGEDAERTPESGDPPKPTKDPRGMGAVNEKMRVGTAVRDGEKHVWGYHQESETRSRVAQSNLKGICFRAPLQCCGAPTPRGVPREKYKKVMNYHQL